MPSAPPSEKVPIPQRLATSPAKPQRLVSVLMLTGSIFFIPRRVLPIALNWLSFTFSVAISDTACTNPVPHLCNSLISSPFDIRSDISFILFPIEEPPKIANPAYGIIAVASTGTWPETISKPHSSMSSALLNSSKLWGVATTLIRSFPAARSQSAPFSKAESGPTSSLLRLTSRDGPPRTILDLAT